MCTLTSPRFFQNTGLRTDDPLNSPIGIPPPGFVQEPLSYPLSGPIEKHKKHSQSRSSRDRRRDTRELARLFALQEQESKDALQTLHQTSRLLEEERQRRIEAEARLAEVQERWKAVNAARINAQKEAAKVQTELAQYRLRFDAAQVQINQANEMIVQSEKERHAAEDEAEKARGIARQYHEERLISSAREEGRRIGREEGRREGRREATERAYNDVYQRAYAQAKEEAFEQMNEYLASESLPPIGAQQEEAYDNGEGDYDERDEEPVDSRVQFPEPSVSPLGRPPSQGRYQSPQQTRSNQPAQRSSSILRRFIPSRSNNSSRRGYGRNVEVNVNAPDVAPILDSLPHQTITTPLPPSRTSQPTRSASRTSMQMPEPDYNVDPRGLRPIPTRNRTPSVQHAPIDLPPDGYVPVADSQGNFNIPPPHELARTPSPPGSAQLPQVQNNYDRHAAPPPPPPKSPRSRDYAYENRLPAPNRSPHAYQQSIPESLASTATSQYDLLGNNPHRSRTPGLDDVMEERESVNRSPVSTRTRTRVSVVSPVIPSLSPRPSTVGRSQDDGYGQSLRRSRNQMPGDDPRYGGMPDVRDGRRQEEVHTFYHLPEPIFILSPAQPVYSPQSRRSFESDVRQTPQMSMPMQDQMYSRPRVNSVGSDIIPDMRSPGGRSGTTTTNRSRHRREASISSIPDINIEPPV